MFVGAVLFVNGLLFLGRIDGQGAIAATVVAVAPVTVASLRQPPVAPEQAEAEAGVPVSVS
jgi:hypothetical protein